MKLILLVFLSFITIIQCQTLSNTVQYIGCTRNIQAGFTYTVGLNAATAGPATCNNVCLTIGSMYFLYFAINTNTCVCGLTYSTTSNVVGDNNCNTACTGAGQTSSTCGSTGILASYYSVYNTNRTTFFTSTNSCQTSTATTSNALNTGIKIPNNQCNCNSGYVATNVSNTIYCNQQTNTTCFYNTSTTGFAQSPAFLDTSSVSLSADTLSGNIISSAITLPNIKTSLGQFTNNRSVTGNFGSIPILAQPTSCGTAGVYQAIRTIVNCYDQYTFNLPFSTFITQQLGIANCSFVQTNLTNQILLTNTFYVSTFDVLLGSQQFGFYPTRNTVSSYPINIILPSNYNQTSVANISSQFNNGRVVYTQYYNVANKTLTLLYSIISASPYVVTGYTYNSLPTNVTLFQSYFINNYVTNCTVGADCTQYIFSQFLVNTCVYSGSYTANLAVNCLSSPCSMPNGTLSIPINGDNGCASISLSNALTTSLTFFSDNARSVTSNTFKQGSLVYAMIAILSPGTPVAFTSLQSYSIIDSNSNEQFLYSNGTTTALGNAVQFIVNGANAFYINATYQITIGSNSTNYLVNQNLDQIQMYTFKTSVNIFYRGINTNSIRKRQNTIMAGSTIGQSSNQMILFNPSLINTEDTHDQISLFNLIIIIIAVFAISFLLGILVEHYILKFKSLKNTKII